MILKMPKSMKKIEIRMNVENVIFNERGEFLIETGFGNTKKNLNLIKI